jgi:hypothetical protein
MSEYTSCMSPFMKGPKELAPGAKSMCVGAKICTGRAKSEEEAIQICQSQPAKPGKVARGSKCLENLDQYVECVMDKINFEADDMKVELTKALGLCICGKKLNKDGSKKMTKVADLAEMDQETLEALAALQGIWGGTHGQEVEAK